MTHYGIDFSDVLLDQPFEPPDDPSPVYLFMQAAVYDPHDPSTALWTASSGGPSPNDANIPSDPNSSPDGVFYPSALPVGVKVRCDVPDTGIPKFGFDDITVEEGQRLSLQIILAPNVWFIQAHEDPSARDSALVGGFGDALTAFLGGPVDSIVKAIWGGGTDADVPCFNPILLETQDWDKNELDALVLDGTHQYGPTGAPGALGCPQAKATYELSFRAVPEFRQNPPGCLVLWVTDEAPIGSFAGDWGDGGFTSTDQVNAWITRHHRAMGEAYDLRLRERQTPSRDVLSSSFTDVPVTEEWLLLTFNRNEFQFEPMGYVPVTPFFADCSSFTNVNQSPPWIDHLYRLNSLAIVAAVWREIAPQRRIPEVPRLPGSGSKGETPQLAPGSWARADAQEPGPRRFSVPPAAVPGRPFPPPGSMFPRSGFFHQYVPSSVNVDPLPVVRVLRLLPTLVLMLYGEFRDDRLLQVRLRYLRTDQFGAVQTDVLLRPTFEPPR